MTDPHPGRRNPNWTRDEAILAVDLYLRRRSSPGDTDPEVIELSRLLNRLPIHTVRPDIEKFRSPGSVALKLANIRDIEFPGMGMSGGGQAEKQVWAELHDRPAEVRRLAEAIRSLADDAQAVAVPEADEDDVETPEGKLLYRMHRHRERSSRLVDRVKAAAIATGQTHCRVCGFDFGRTYGALGQGFIEAHHVLPLAAAGERRSRASDLILVCSNCHSMLHRKRPWGTPDELRAIIDKRR